MKAYKYLVPVIALGFATTGCNMNEEPKSAASVEMVFSSEKGIETYATSFYNALPSPADAMKLDATSDYGAKNSIGGMEVGAYTVNSSTSWSWGTLRNINFFLENNTSAAIPERVRNNYNGQARMWRAYFYIDKLIQYGEVPWIDKVFNSPEDPDLYKGRDTRDVIIKNIIEDLDYAIENITEKNATANANYINVWTAYLLKSRICLFEGTWRKYHANDELDFARTGCTEYAPNQLFQLAADAAKAVMENGPYSLYTGKAYANGRGAYRELFISDAAVKQEVMLGIQCDITLRKGEANWWYNSSTYGPHLSMTRKFAKSYLNIDGTPYNEFNADGTYKDFVSETTDRDTRLNQTIRACDYTRKNGQGAYEPTSANFTGHSMTGYQFTKYVMDDVACDDGAKNENDIPFMRYAEILLNYAEAKAEMGTMSDDDWANTIGALRKRAGITGGTAQTGTLTTKPTQAEPYIASYYPGVTDPVILEVRRDRSIELCLEGFRIKDLKRWGQIDLFTSDPWEGVFIPSLNTALDMNGDGVDDVCFYDTEAAPDGLASIGLYIGTAKNNKINVVSVNGGYIMKNNTGEGRSWPERQYLYPIPEVVRQLNPNLSQNPGW